jgi:uncharacterized protein YaeQ
VALSSTVYAVEIDLADSDRNIYESLALRVARHPSESEDFLVARVLAYCCEYAPGIAFSRGGLSDPDEPPIAIRDDGGAMRAWIDIGTPAADRLHRASKAVPRVAVYVHRDGGTRALRARSRADCRVRRPARSARVGGGRHQRWGSVRLVRGRDGVGAGQPAKAVGAGMINCRGYTPVPA